LFNKYNSPKINDLFYDFDDKNELIIRGLLKINWNIKNPIKLINESVVPINFKQTSIEENDDDYNVNNKYCLILFWSLK
jgi:hypothetical protein